MPSLFDGARKLPGLLFGGRPNAGLSAAQNAEAAKQAQMMAGLQMLMASRSGAGQPAPGLMQILAQGALAGQQVGGAARGNMQMQQAMQNPAMGLTPQQRAYLAALPPAAQQAVLAQLATAGGAGPQVVGPNGALVGAGGEEIYRNDAGGDLSAGMPEILASLGVPIGTPADQIPQAIWEAALKRKAELGARGPLVNVDTGTIPPGYRAERDPQGRIVAMTPIPGGPAERAIEADERAQAEGNNMTVRAARTVVEDVDRALSMLDEYGRAAIGPAGLTRAIPGTPAHRISMMVESIKGNIGIDSLLRIKKSGAGLGQVPQSQLNMLASLLGMLDTTMNEQDLRYNLERIGEIYTDIIRQAGGEISRDPNTGQWVAGGVGFDDLVPGSG